MFIVFKRCRDAFHSRFAELEQIVNTPFDFARVVLAIGNQLDMSKVQQFDWVPNRTKLSLTVASSHCDGESKLSPQNWQVVESAANDIVFLEETRLKLLDYLTTQMQIVAPNTSKLVGASVCAKLIAAAGGLNELSLTPACNIQVLGSERRVLNGFSTKG